MKTLVKILIAVAINSFATILFSQNSIEQTYYTAINPKEANTVFFDLKGNLEMEVWKENYILFYLTVDSNAPNEKVMDQLKENGRYVLKVEFDVSNYMFLTLPNIDQIVKINGIDLEENLKYKVKVPWYLSVDIGCQNDVVTYYDEPSFEDTEEGNLFTMTQIKY